MNFWEMFYKNKLALTGSGIVLLLFLVSLFAPWFAPYDPGQIDLKNVLAGAFAESFIRNGSAGP